MRRKRPTGRGGARPGSGRKVDPEHPGMPKENAITLHLPDELAAYISDLAQTWDTSRPEAVREVLRRSRKLV